MTEQPKSGLTMAALLKAKELLDAAEVPAGPRSMYMRGRNLQALRTGAGLPRLENVVDDTVYFVADIGGGYYDVREVDFG